MTSDNKLMIAIQSRKLWMAVIGLILILITAWNQDPFPTDAVVTAIMGVVGAYVASVAYEDGKHAEAVAKIAAGESTTVVTPSDNVTVTTESKPQGYGGR